MSHRTGWAAAALLLGLYWLMAVAAARGTSATFDEPAHLTAGMSSWATGDDRLLSRVGGPFAARWPALPLYLGGTPPPSPEPRDWEESRLLPISHRWLYGSGLDADAALWKARAMVALLGVLLGALLYAWSAELHGVEGGLLTAALFAFCPSMQAHGALVTADMAAAAFFAAFIYAFWRLLDRPTPLKTLAVGAAWGLLFLSKVTAVLSLPMAAILVAARGRRRWAALACGAAVILIWAAYGFRPGGGFRILPGQFLDSYEYILGRAGARRAFLNGRYSLSGWWYYYPYAFLVKTPLALFGLLAAALLGRGRNGETPLWVLIAVYAAAAIASRVDTGQRLLLPVYPPLFVLAGGAVRRVPDLIVAGLLAWYAGDSVAAWPNHLAYFNELAGGPRNGWRHLADSSVDWGQDLPAVKNWLEGREGPVYLSYFGAADPDYYGIKAKLLPGAINYRSARTLEPWRGGVYLISASMLQGIGTAVFGPWTADNEQAYRNSRGDPERFDALRLTRLCAFLREREPDGMIGRSILIFRLTDADLQQALEGPLPRTAPPRTS